MVYFLVFNLPAMFQVTKNLFALINLTAEMLILIFQMGQCYLTSALILAMSKYVFATPGIAGARNAGNSCKFQRYNLLELQGETEKSSSFEKFIAPRVLHRFE